MITLKRKIHLKRSSQLSQRRGLTEEQPAGRVPRISRLMALAIKFDRLLQEGVITDQSELARLAHVTQPRMTQIMNLLHLAPDIQEQLLFLPRVTNGRDPIHEKMLRPIAAMASWADQRRSWDTLLVKHRLHGFSEN